MGSPSPPNSPLSSDRVRIVVATSVMLTFISYWRAAAIILNDLGSSAFYAGGIAEQASESAPLVHHRRNAVLVCGPGGLCRKLLDVRSGRRLSHREGGYWRHVAKVAVSALMFDYVLTGPISGVSAGQYLGGLLNEFCSTPIHGLIPARFIGLWRNSSLPVNWISVSRGGCHHFFLVGEH